MHLMETVSPETNVCGLANRWTIDVLLATKIVSMTSLLPFKLRLMSGHRTEAQQDELRRQGRPTAAPGVSTHTSCPATGADLTSSIAATKDVKQLFGAAALQVGLRWGGGSTVDPETLIPSDWQHVDLGPRR